ncbi:MAG: hypothetical protein D6775_08155 [Caldilineae bacterium]|nr:MAG: hypothetical protein D6775_08155 [Caldilineae bacterium]
MNYGEVDWKKHAQCVMTRHLWEYTKTFRCRRCGLRYFTSFMNTYLWLKGIKRIVEDSGDLYGGTLYELEDTSAEAKEKVQMFRDSLAALVDLMDEMYKEHGEEVLG